MKKMMKRTAAVVLAVAISAGAGGALAYDTPDFNDVPAGNWAYSAVMEMADAGVIKGTGPETFAPGMEVSAAMWLTLVGRVAFEDAAKAAAQDGDTWYSAYARVAKAKGLLLTSNVKLENVEDGITRYDMASILSASLELMGVGMTFRSGDKLWNETTSKIADFAEVASSHSDYKVVHVYSLGLITGDGQGNFNGADTMTRAEAAVVMSRLLDLKAQADAGTLPPIEPETPRTGETVDFTITGRAVKQDHDLNKYPMAGISLTLHYKDGRKLGTTTSDASGNFSITVTVDEADYTTTGSVYYFSAYGVDQETGVEYYCTNRATNNLYSAQNSWIVLMDDTIH